VPAVEHQQLGAVFHPQHIGEVVELIAVRGNRVAGDEIVLDIQPLHTEIGAHGNRSSEIELRHDSKESAAASRPETGTVITHAARMELR
jgi:hypothetical protein